MLAVVIGAALMWAYGDFDLAPSDADARVNKEFFISELAARPVNRTYPRVSDIRVFPARENVRLIKFTSASPGRDRPFLSERFLYLGDSDFRDAHFRLGFGYHDVWWATPSMW